MKTKEGQKSLAEIIKEKFVGPFNLVCVSASKDATFPSAIRYESADNNAAEKIAQALDLDAKRLPITFGVAAFFGKVGRVYPCYLRLRGRIIEAVPDNRGNLEKSGEWRPAMKLSTFELVFKQDDRGRWSARHPETEQYIQAFDMNLQPTDGNKARFAPGAIAIRPACTRTFWIAGDPQTVKVMCDYEIEAYEEKAEEDFSYAPQFQLCGRYFTAFEVMGDPTIELVDLDSFLKEPISQEFERWATRAMLAALHPDNLNRMSGISGKVLDKALTLAEETRNNIRALTSWYRRWAEHFVHNFRYRRAIGLPTSIPKPVGREPRKDFRLMDLEKQDIEKMLLKPRTTIKSATKSTKPKETKPDPKKQEPVPVKKAAPPIVVATSGEENNTIGDLVNGKDTAKKPEEKLVGKNGKVAVICSTAGCGRTVRVGPKTAESGKEVLCAKCKKKNKKEK